MPRLEILAAITLTLLGGCGRPGDPTTPSAPPCVISLLRLSLPSYPTATLLYLDTEITAAAYMQLAPSPGGCAYPKPESWAVSPNSVVSTRSYGAGMAIKGRALGTATLRVTRAERSDSALLQVEAFPPLPRFRTLTTGLRATCALTGAGEVYCWGFGELVRGRASPWIVDGVPFPVRQVPAATFSSLSASELSACGVTAAGLQCWGDNRYGQLGNGSPEPQVEPVSVVGGERFEVVSMGADHACALDRQGQAYCWGANHVGQLGNLNEGLDQVPSKVITDLTFRAIAASALLSCGVTDDGQLHCWGAGRVPGFRQSCEIFTGKGTTVLPCEGRPTPVLHDPAVSSPPQYTSIALGPAGGCGLASDGVAWCWGVGSGARSDYLAPVAGLPPLAEVTVGNNHACGISIDGTGYCWGSGPEGELGNGTTVGGSGPVPIATTEPLATIRAGGVHTCALTRQGHALCWGANERGQLGIGREGDSSVPIKVLGHR